MTRFFTILSLAIPLMIGGGTATTTTTATATELLAECDAPDRRISLRQWPNTDFTRCTVGLGEVIGGGPGKDGIPALDAPVIIPIAEESNLTAQEPVISLTINGESRAWPLRYLIWHEIVNDTLGGVPVAATYCPLCNAALVFERRLGEAVLDFGTTGNLRKSDLIMYDRQSESWWQQYTGEGIFGEYAGERLTVLASRLESWAEFTARNPDGTVAVPPRPWRRQYGVNPYRGYDTSPFPFLFDGTFPEGIAPLARVVVVEGQAIALALLQEMGAMMLGDIALTWRAGQASALDTSLIAEGRDIGTVTAQRDGTDIPYDMTFAFVYHAFMPDGEIRQK